jgi:hypothetical protein
VCTKECSYNRSLEEKNHNEELNNVYSSRNLISDVRLGQEECAQGFDLKARKKET